MTTDPESPVARALSAASEDPPLGFVVWRAWFEGMESQGRHVAVERRSWDTLSEQDKNLDAVIESRVALFALNLRRADRPEARVAEGLTCHDFLPSSFCEHTDPALPAPRPPEPDLPRQEWPEPCCYLNHEVDEPCGLPPVKVVFTQTMDSIPAPRVAEGLTEFRALVDEARANHVRWEHEAEVLEECLRPLCIGAKMLLWPDIEDPRSSALPAPRPPEPVHPLQRQPHPIDGGEAMTTDPETPDCLHDVATATEYCADCHAVFSPEAGWFHPRRADRPEARVAEGLTVDYAMVERAIRTSLPADMVYSYAPHGDPFARWAQRLYDNLAYLPAPRPPEPDRCSECGVPIAEHPPTDACAIAQESRPPEPDRTAALVEAWREYLPATREEFIEQLTDRGYDNLLALLNALAATPEPAPVADGTVCGHKRYRGDLPCGATADDDWHKRGTWEQDPELYHPFTPTPPTDGAASPEKESDHG